VRTKVRGSGLAALVRAVLSPYNLSLALVVGAALIVGYAVASSYLLLAAAFAAVLVFFPSVSLGAAVLSANLRTSLPGLPSGLTFSDVFLGLFVLGWLREAITSGRGRVPPKWTAWLLAFLTWAWCSLLITHADASALALARVTLYSVVFLCAAARQTSRSVLRVLLGFGVLEAVVALAGVTPRLGSRLLGTLGDPAMFGLLMLFTLAAIPLFRGKQARRISYAVVGLAVVSTFTRGVWIGGVIEAVLLVAPRVTRRLLLAIVVVSSVFVVAVALQGVATQRLNLNPGSLSLRQRSWAEGLRIAEARPLTGTGWALAGDAGVPNPYNLWINVAASTGIVGALLLAAFMFCLARHLVRHRDNPVSRVGFIYLAGFMAVSLGEMTVYAASPATITLFAVMGLVVGSGTSVMATGSAAVSLHSGDQPIATIGRDALRQRRG
jgi:hypothetical protein